MSKITTQGFDPKNLTFNSVKIEAGDHIEVGYDGLKWTVIQHPEGYDEGLYINLIDSTERDAVCMELSQLNITAHYPKKQVLKRPNGSLLERVENGEKYYNILTNGYISACTEYRDFVEGEQRHLSGNYFATEEEAQAWLDKLKVYYRLKLKIDQINAENGWVAWRDSDCEYYLTTRRRYDSQGDYKMGKDYDSTQKTDRYSMSEQAKDFMMSDEVSDEDFKTFLEVSASF